MNNLDEKQVKPLSEIWRCAGGDCSRRSLFPKKVKIKAKPDLVLKLDSSIQASVVFDSSATAYVADTSGKITAFSRDGKLVWQLTLDSGVFATPAVHQSKPVLYAGIAGGFLYAIDTENAKVLWKSPIPTTSDSRILSDLLYLQTIDAVILSSWGGRFHAIGADDGKEKFSWNAGISPSSAATADSTGAVYTLRAVEGIGVELVRISPDGKESSLFRQAENKRGARRTLVRACPVINELTRTIYFVMNLDRGAILYAFSIEKNTVLWKSVLPVCVQASPIILADGSIVVFDLRGMMICFTNEGLVKYHYQTEADYLLCAGVSDISSVVFLGDVSGRLHVVNETGKGKIVFESSRSIQSQPSFSPQCDLYLPSTDHNVYVFRNIE